MTILWHGGATRIVVLTGRWAIKFPTFMYGWKFLLYGFLANMQEREWAGFDGRLCPIHYAAPGGMFIVMPRCQILTDDEFLEYVHDDWIRMCDKETGLPLPYSAELPVELKSCSFGWLNDRIVAVDYGGCGRKSETTRTVNRR
jgi:hypothetical protein